MRLEHRPFTAALIAGLLALPIAPAAYAETITPAQRGEIERIIQDYLLRIPKCCRR